MFPLASINALGKPGIFLIEVLIGFAFGFGLEISGFSNSYVLTGQFYFRNGRVIKAMFTAILLAMVLIFGAVALGILDYDVIWVDPTYLWPGIVGGLLMGLGIIIGGYCPGTSIVSSVSLKKDAWFFVLGGLFGTFLFSETEPLFHYFYNDSFYGRLTVMDVFHLSTGLTVTIFVILGILLFWLNDVLVRKYAREDSDPFLKSGWVGRVAIVLVVGALIVWAIWPTWQQKWARVAPKKAPLLEQYQVQISPAELLSSLQDHKTNTVVIDVRDDYSYNLFHLKWEHHVPLNELDSYAPIFKKEVKEVPLTVFVVVSDDEGKATEGWKILQAEGVPNVYILSGGFNNLIRVFGDEDMEAGLLAPASSSVSDVERLNYYFKGALGDRYRASDLSANDEWAEEMLEKLKFKPKIKLQKPKGVAGGGCG